MQVLLSKINIQINEHTFLKDPDSSDLGRRIIAKSVEMIDDMGFEQFTFRKLGIAIGSTEASVYRYFESKHKLLLYLTNWYWGWMEYKMVIGLTNINSPQERLERAIDLLTEEINEEIQNKFIDIVKLNRVVICESSKSYLTCDVDIENRDNVFLSYKQLVQRVSDIVTEINPGYKYPHMLVSTVIEGAHHQRFFASHLPRLTDVIKGEDAIKEFYKEMVFKTIASK